MKILVANLGSTSFKYRLFDMAGQAQLARGRVERIGSPESRCMAEIGDRRQERTARVADHAEAVRQCLAQLTDPQTGCLADSSEISAIAFKAVHGGRLSGVQRVTPDVLAAMEEFADVAPAHNPPYIAAMRLLGEKLPEIPLAAVFETDFHRTIPDCNRYYAVPYEWAEECLVRRWGFHGASHRYIAERTAELIGPGLRIISCHLGGSSSMCAIRDGRSAATSMGFSPQSGLPQNNRAGDFDPFVLPAVIKRTGKTLEELLSELSNRSGLLGLSGTSGDLRDIEQSAGGGDARA
ncbi:MAG: acetate/propionate family kinase, partial [Planctomycetes bacterium]|nr:acetate/propionate family kinase [Planctomycetota bacterium]